MADYVQAQGENGLVMVSRDDLTALCNPDPAYVTEMCHQDVASVPVTRDNVAATVVNQSSALQQSPKANAGVMGGGTLTTYRFIAPSTGPYGGFDTGANHANCSPSNVAACDPQHFATLLDAYNYARTHNEVPIMVTGSDQAFAIIAGQASVTPDMLLTAQQAQQGGQGLSMTEMLLIGGAALLLLK
jgi:hypothetical protein